MGVNSHVGGADSWRHTLGGGLRAWRDACDVTSAGALNGQDHLT